MGRAAVWLSAGLLGGAVFAGGFFIGKRAEPERAFAAPDRSAAIARSPVPQQASRTRSPGLTTAFTVSRRQRRSRPAVITRFITS